MISSPEDDGVKDVIRALQSGDGFLFEDVDLEITRVLSRVKVGFQMIAEEGCGEVDLRSCKVVAYSVGRGVDGRKLDLEWVFLFRSESSARSGSRDIEGYFEDEMPSEVEVEVEDVEQDGEYVVVTASIDEEDLSLSSRITVVNVRPRPTADVIFPTFTPTTITPTSIAPSTIPTAAGMVQVGTLVEGDIGSSGEVDEYQVTLDGGSTYIIETVLDTLNDSELYIFDVDGQTELDYNDDFLNRESRVEFTAPRSGVYHIRVNGFDTSVGSYQLSITEDVLATATASNGAQEAMDTEYQTIQSAVFAMMSDNALSSLPNPVNIAGSVQNMAAFPDGTSVAGSADKLTDPNGNPYRAGDLAGYTLFGHDIAGDGAAIGLVNYVAPGTTTYFYVIARDGSIGQYDSTGVLTNGIVVPTVLVPAFPAPLPIGNMVLIGMSVEGDIRSSGEVDEYGVLLEGGSTYIIKTELGTLPDSVLYILDIDGQTQLGFNDDFLDRESRIDFTAPRTGVYFVQVNGFSVSVGSYALSITEDFSVVIPTAVPTAVAVEVPVTVEVPVIQTVEAVVTPTPVILVEKSQVTVVFGGSPKNLGVYGAPGCAIIPQHFPCQDAATDVLTYIDSTTFEVVPLSGVQSWEQIEIDRWRFELTPGVKFHNGEEWNAAAAKAGIDWQSDISNGQASVFYTGTAVGEVIDDLTVDVVCDDPCPIFPKTGFLIGFQAPEWVANASELDKVSTTIGFGPYEITEWDLGIDVTMEKYDDYVPNANAPNDASAPTIDVIKMVWRDEPLVRAAMVQVGEVDWAFDLGLDQVDQVPVFDHGGAAETFVNVFDTIWHPELSKTQVRQALAYATDCQTIVDELYDGFYECQGTYAPPGTLGVTARTLAPYPFDPDLAVELLKEANYDPTNEIVINVFAGRFFRNVEVAEAQAQMWRDVGVTVSVENLETAKWLDVARTGCGRAIEEFANLDNPPEDFCLSLDPGPPSFASPNTYQLNPSLETLDFARALNRMDCLDLTAKFCDPVNVQPLIGPARAAVGDDRLAKITELAGISYDEAIIYTYFNAEVFYGVSKDLIWEPRYDRRLRVNQWRFR